jgi:hypothetical protein
MYMSFDINETEKILEVFFDRFKDNENYIISLPYFASRLSEQFEGEFRYVQFKGNHIKGKLEGVALGQACKFHFPRGIYSKIKTCCNRNSKDIKSYDTVRLHFKRFNRKRWDITCLEVENVRN